MTRIGKLLARAIILALLLLSIGGGVASAGGRIGTTSLPDDPGYGLTP